MLKLHQQRSDPVGNKKQQEINVREIDQLYDPLNVRQKAMKNKTNNICSVKFRKNFPQQITSNNNLQNIRHVISIFVLLSLARWEASLPAMEVAFALFHRRAAGPPS